MKLFKPDTSFTEDPYEKASFNLAWRLSVVFVIVFGILAGIFSGIQLLDCFIYSTVFILAVFSLLYMHKTKKSRFIFWLFTISASCLVTFSINTMLDTLHYADLLWIACIILFAYFGLSYKVAYFFIAFHSLSLIYYISFGLNQHIEQLHARSDWELIAVSIESTLAFLIMSYLIHRNTRYQSFVLKELKQANEDLKTRNSENITLLKEVHHRVKNNLQIVVSLLRIQSSEIKSEEAKEQFGEAINRVMTISMIHQKLYQSGELSQLQFKKYISELVNDIRKLHTSQENIQINLESNLVEINLKVVVPVGLIVNELITNSIKHAFQQDETGTIDIHFSTMENGKNLILYQDSGTWKEGTKTGFGAELIELLSEQIEGTLIRKGSAFRIEFPSS